MTTIYIQKYMILNMRNPTSLKFLTKSNEPGKICLILEKVEKWPLSQGPSYWKSGLRISKESSFQWNLKLLVTFKSSKRGCAISKCCFLSFYGAIKTAASIGREQEEPTLKFGNTFLGVFSNAWFVAVFIEKKLKENKKIAPSLNTEKYILSPISQNFHADAKGNFGSKRVKMLSSENFEIANWFEIIEACTLELPRGSNAALWDIRP